MTHCIPREALSWHIAVLAKTGAGKTYAIRGDVVEPLLDASERVCIIDPTDAWHGLRSSATGKSGGYPVVIFGGEHGDLPLQANHGEAIAEIVGTSSTSCILVTKHLSIRDRTKFFTDFAEAIMRKNRGPLHLIIDEAHRFAPKAQKMSPQSGEMLSAANELVSAGRSAGLRVILITQRPAKLHNDSLEQVETLVAMRIIGPADRKAVLAWVKENASEELAGEILQSLAKLKTGEGWVWCPQLDYLQRVRFPKIRTYDSGAAPESRVAGKSQVLAPIDRDAISERLKAVGVDVVANDPAALKRRIAELERQVAQAPTAQPSPELLDLARRNGFEEARKELASLAHMAAKAAAAELRDAAAMMGRAAERILTENKAPEIRIEPKLVRELRARQDKHFTPNIAAARESIANGKISPSARKILDSIHKAYPVALSFDSAARRAGISKASSAYGKYAAEVLNSGEVVSDNAGGRFTSLPQFARSEPMKPGASVDQWAAKLPPSYGRMLLAIRDGHHSRQGIANQAGVSLTSSGLSAGLKELIRLALITEGDGVYTLSDGM